MVQEIQTQRVRAVRTMQSHIFIRKSWSYGSKLLCYDAALKDYVLATVIGLADNGASLRIETILKGRRYVRVVSRNAYFIVPRPVDVEIVMSHGWFDFHDMC